ncbi:unnamed protein product [Camellia sinensis]
MGTMDKEAFHGCHDKHIFYAYLIGSNVPDWINLKNIGSSISFTVPSYVNFKIKGVSLCYICAFSSNRKVYGCAHTIISNKTKSLIWSHRTRVFGKPETNEDVKMLSYWKFDNQLEGGNELNILVVGDDENFQIKQVRVRLVYKEKEEKNRQSTNEEASEQISLYGNVFPGYVSAHPTSTKVYYVSIHFHNCPICSRL